MATPMNDRAKKWVAYIGLWLIISGLVSELLYAERFGYTHLEHFGLSCLIVAGTGALCWFIGWAAKQLPYE